MTIIMTSLGGIEGAWVDGTHQFLGLPYAEGITTERRFLPPIPKRPWQGVLVAERYGAISFQKSMPGLFEYISPDPAAAGEDCLNLNVWTPDLKASLPVMVWIHGGAFYSGSGSEDLYSGIEFAKSGVVCVTINYRLGAQGFLDLSAFGDRYESSGCVGIMDQVCALEWVKKHIAQFGGDPDRVTIAGESAGSMSVSTLMATPSAKGSFQQAIAQSGAANNTLPKKLSGIITRELFSKLGIHEPSDLDAISDEALLEAQVELMAEIGESQDVERFGLMAGNAMPFQPVHECAFLPEPPIVAITKGSAKAVALLQGITRHEAPIFYYEMADVLTDELAWLSFSPMLHASGLDEESARNYYLGRDGHPLTKAGAFMSDAMFAIPTLAMLNAQVEHNLNTWAYRFDWENPGFNGLLQAHHFIEIPFVFNTLASAATKKFGIDQAPKSLVDVTHKAWVTFVTHGDPNHLKLPAWPRWKGVTSQRCMAFNETCQITTLVDDRTLSVWGLS
jgi:para-nitrobenzyl esterase